MAAIPDIQLEKYTLEAELSRNEWSTLYQGRCKADQLPVAIRVIAPLFTDDEYFVRRFKQIAQQNAGLEHPNILPSYKAEQSGGYLYVVQEWVETRSLAQVIESEGPFSLRRTQCIVAQIASALDYVHQKSLTHGDLSAYQIYLGADDQVWLTNFGLSQLLFGSNVTKHGLPGQAVETLAPERVGGQGPSRQSDLYSLGVLGYQMLSKRLPFSGPSSVVLRAQAYQQPRPLHRVNPGIPVAVSETVGRMLSKSVDVRYNTGAEFARALLMARQQKGSARLNQNLLPLLEREQRRPAARAVTYAFVGLVIVLSLVALSLWAGYELGLKHALAGTSFPQNVLRSVISTPTAARRQATPTLEPSLAANPRPTAVASPTLESLVVLSDRLAPTQQPVQVRNLRLTATPPLTATPTLTPTFPTLVPLAWLGTPSPTPAPIMPPNQGLFIFANPTGYDLIIDLTGPTNASVLVPPDLQEEFVLEAGDYQYIIHTPTGNWLETKVGTFELAGSEVIQKDYYSQHDLTVSKN